MNRGVVLKALHETWLATFLFGVGLLLAEAFLAFVLPTLERQIGDILPRLIFVQKLISSLVGMDVGDKVSPNLLTAFRWVHPVVLALFWAQAIVFCTRNPAGEVDRGTIDVLLGLPVSRWELFLSDSAVWLASATFAALMALAGGEIGSTLAGAEGGPGASRTAIVVINLLGLNVLVGAIASLVSALSDRRGRAIAVVFGVLLATFLLNYLSQFWQPAQSLSFLSMLTYYRPMLIVRDGAWPVKDLLTLGGAALAFWLAAGWTFSRRDLSTT